MKDQQTLLRRIISASLDLRNERKIAEVLGKTTTKC